MRGSNKPNVGPGSGPRLPMLDPTGRPVHSRCHSRNEVERGGRQVPPSQLETLEGGCNRIEHRLDFGEVALDLD